MNKKMLEKIKNINENDPFLVSITVFNKKGDKLDTFLFASKFPYEEFEGTKKMINKLIDGEKKRNK
ncbi:MAG: hypothetical protein COY10_01950 [Candidatus Portnoybacteria bacterium CG_4_10_14_0_2_um_filter_43_36]|jgi:hypothetical protein|uniref:Uncharacterized protein n=2 Tax=Candidatus Portnoyibacteriota TaxID=1817913 RepID=A0A2M8KHB4_9BACT|nr:MAG: hypothetical protein COY10_01950 [Candidatus Portnoybacteria bacterium CG_4_10_14_0_2_um_filter_43_36]PJE59302.1 MAG: hypothetical protein COU84_01595 [Candidatus Portnoybacteria bacterium CG10_big_fil_rev_8_21_14_0_10_43_39]